MGQCDSEAVSQWGSGAVRHRKVKTTGGEGGGGQQVSNLEPRTQRGMAAPPGTPRVAAAILLFTERVLRGGF